jgi:RNA polymerase-binding transcription factor DksA
MKNSMVDGKVHYTAEDLVEFKEILQNKLESARNELTFIRETLNKSKDNGTDNTTGAVYSMMEDGAESLEKESLNQLAARQVKFITQMENALLRIKNGTYGICIETGKLIPKERLRAVPHTQHSIEAKMSKL